MYRRIGKVSSHSNVATSCMIDKIHSHTWCQWRKSTWFLVPNRSTNIKNWSSLNRLEDSRNGIVFLSRSRGLFNPRTTRVGYELGNTCRGELQHYGWLIKTSIILELHHELPKNIWRKWATSHWVLLEKPFGVVNTWG